MRRFMPALVVSAIVVGHGAVRRRDPRLSPGDARRRVRSRHGHRLRGRGRRDLVWVDRAHPRRSRCAATVCCSSAWRSSSVSSRVGAATTPRSTRSSASTSSTTACSGSSGCARSARGRADLSAPLLALDAMLLVAIADEGVQWWVAARTGELYDVGLNVYAGATGILFGLALDGPRSLRWRLGRGSGVCSRVSAPSPWSRWRRSFTPPISAIASTTPRSAPSVPASPPTLCALRAAIAPRGGRLEPLGPPGEFAPLEREDWFRTEGGMRVQHRNAALERGDVYQAWKENLILERWYAPFLDQINRDGNPFRLPAATRDDLERQAPAARSVSLRQTRSGAIRCASGSRRRRRCCGSSPPCWSWSMLTVPAVLTRRRLRPAPPDRSGPREALLRSRLAPSDPSFDHDERILEPRSDGSSSRRSRSSCSPRSPPVTRLAARSRHAAAELSPPTLSAADDPRSRSRDAPAWWRADIRWRVRSAPTCWRAAATRSTPRSRSASRSRWCCPKPATSAAAAIWCTATRRARRWRSTTARPRPAAATPRHVPRPRRRAHRQEPASAISPRACRARWPGSPPCTSVSAACPGASWSSPSIALARGHVFDDARRRNREGRGREAANASRRRSTCCLPGGESARGRLDLRQPRPRAHARAHRRARRRRASIAARPRTWWSPRWSAAAASSRARTSPAYRRAVARAAPRRVSRQHAVDDAAVVVGRRDAWR